jgi:hypothetical protein
MTREKILKTFLKIPLNIEMNSNIFENNEDMISISSPLLKK